MKAKTKEALEKVAKAVVGAGVGFAVVLGLRRLLRRAPAQPEVKPSPSPSPSPAPSGPPPNLSGDPLGYDSNLFDGPEMVRYVFTRVGYDVEEGTEPLTDAEAKAAVRMFQRQWNRVSKAISSGKVKPKLVPGKPAGQKYSGEKVRSSLRGQLAEDGIPGRNTLRALEIAWRQQGFNDQPWKSLVTAAG